MRFIIRSIKPVMLVSGILTCTMLYALVAPQAALVSTFGASLDGPVAQVVVRSWGSLVGLVGAMLIYGAYRPHVRRLVLAVAGASKLVFVALVLTFGAELVAKAAIPLVLDSIWVLVFAAYLVATHERASAPGTVSA